MLEKLVMKHVFASAGLLALGATILHAYDPEMTRQQGGRMWTVAATVRGFYDDNVNTSPNGAYVNGIKIHPKVQSYGVEFSPSAHLNIPLEQTFIALGYIYSLRWYDNREPTTDQAHEFNGKLRHQFSPRHSLGVDDSFILTQEPTTVDRFGIITTPTRTRTDSDVLHNRGSIDDSFMITRQFGLSFGYQNDWYDYEQEGPGSRSALLDRIDHIIRADARYQFAPNLVGLVGYSLGIDTFTGDDFILDPASRAAVQNTLINGVDPVTGNPLTPQQVVGLNRSLRLKSEDRNAISHYGYVGGDIDLTTKFRASLRVGAQFIDFHDLGESSVNPYADASLTYVYLPGDSIELGVRHARNATDVVGVDDSGTPTLDAETTVVYAQLIHKITPKLTGTLIGQFQTSDFNEGAADGHNEDLYLVGVNLTYSFNRYFSMDAGYNYDMLQSDEGRSYYRNRAYVGLRVSY